MIRALILKELREHAWVIGALLLFEAAALAIMMINAKDDGSAFAALRSFTLSMGVLGALVANNRLVVREYVSRTQLFLETLPVTRLRVLTVKLFLGAAAVVIPALFALAACAVAAKGSEPVGPRYLAILAVRISAYLLGLHAVAFLAAMLGRYRFVFWCSLFAGYLLLEAADPGAVEKFSPFLLVNAQLPFERHHFPWTDVLVTGVAGVAVVAAALALGLTAEGGLAANLARKMSHREKVFFGGLALFFIVAQETIKDRKPRPLFELAQAARANEGQTFVGVATGNEDAATREEALEIGKAVAADLDSLRVWLGMTEMPPVFIVPDSSLDPELFVRAALSDTDGVVIKAALSNPVFDGRAFRTFVISEVLGWYSRERSRREPMTWFSEGLAGWWVERSEADDRLALRATAAAREGLTVERVQRWLTERERLGPCLGSAVETHLVGLLAEQAGAVPFQALARRALGQRPHNDVRAVLTRRSIEQLMSELGPLKLEALVAAFNQRLAEDRRRLAEPLSKLRRLTSSLERKSVGNSGIEVFHAVDAVPKSAESVDYTVRYRTLGPWEGPTSLASLPRFDTRGSGVLPRVFSRGARLFWAFEVHEPGLGCNIRFASDRTELW